MRGRPEGAGDGKTGNVRLEMRGGQPGGKDGVRAPLARPEAFRSAFEQQGGVSGLEDPAAHFPLQRQRLSQRMSSLIPAGLSFPGTRWALHGIAGGHQSGTQDGLPGPLPSRRSR